MRNFLPPWDRAPQQRVTGAAPRSRLTTTDFQILIDPIGKLVGQREGDIAPERNRGIGPARQVEQRDQEIVEQVGGLLGSSPLALRRVSRPSYTRGREGAWEKRACCGIDIPDVIDGQDAGSDGTLGPTAQRGPKCHPVRPAAEALGGTAAASPERAPAPQACRGRLDRSLHSGSVSYTHLTLPTN